MSMALLVIFKQEPEEIPHIKMRGLTSKPFLNYTRLEILYFV